MIVISIRPFLRAYRIYTSLIIDEYDQITKRPAYKGLKPIIQVYDTAHQPKVKPKKNPNPMTDYMTIKYDLPKS